MALTDYQIDDAALQDKGVRGMADIPGLTAQQMQEKLDEIAVEVIIPRLNSALQEAEDALALRPTAGQLGDDMVDWLETQPEALAAFAEAAAGVIDTSPKTAAVAQTSADAQALWAAGYYLFTLPQGAQPVTGKVLLRTTANTAAGNTVQELFSFSQGVWYSRSGSAASHTDWQRQMQCGGGSFTGTVTAHSTARSQSCLRNIEVRTGSQTGTLQSTDRIILVRKGS